MTSRPADVAPGSGETAASNSPPLAAAEISPPARPATPDGGGVAGSADAPSPLAGVLKPVLAVVANLTVVTALLVYFGWRRVATQSEELGLDESVFGLSTREYLLRSVGPVLMLLVGIGVVGLAWVAIDRRLAPFVTSSRGPDGLGRADAVLRVLSASWVILPATTVLLGYPWPTLGYVLFPMSIAIGILLWLYAAHLRAGPGAADRTTRRRNTVAQAVTILLVAICTFWTASNYAEVQGKSLARQFVKDLVKLPGVAVSSQHRLHLQGPGVVETELPDGEGFLRYRYSGLRLLDRAGGRYFLISDGWSTTYGVVFILRDTDNTIRVDFVRDRRQA